MEHTSSALLILRLLESAWNETTGSPGSALLGLHNPVNQFLLILSLCRILTSTCMYLHPLCLFALRSSSCTSPTDCVSWFLANWLPEGVDQWVFDGRKGGRYKPRGFSLSCSTSYQWFYLLQILASFQEPLLPCSQFLLGMVLNFSSSGGGNSFLMILIPDCFAILCLASGISHHVCNCLKYL